MEKQHKTFLDSNNWEKKIENSLVYIVNIPEGDDIYSTSKGNYYIRVGSTKQQPTQQELLRLFQKRNLIQFDEIPVLSADINSIDILKVNKYLKKIGSESCQRRRR